MSLIHLLGTSGFYSLQMGTCGFVIDRELLVLCFVLKYKTMRHMNGLQTKAYSHQRSQSVFMTSTSNLLNCIQNICWNISSVSHLNPMDETGDSNSVICSLPKSNVCLAPQLPANIYQKWSEGEGMARLDFHFCVAHGTHHLEWRITDFSNTPAVFCVLLINEEQTRQ